MRGLKHHHKRTKQALVAWIWQQEKASKGLHMVDFVHLRTENASVSQKIEAHAQATARLQLKVAATTKVHSILLQELPTSWLACPHAVILCP